MKSVIKDWNENRVDYCLWKGSHNLANCFIGADDLDILMDRAHLEKAFQILRQNSFRCLTVVPLRSTPGIYDFIKYDPSIGKWLYIHLHFQIISGEKWTGNLHLSFEKQILENKVWNQKHEIWTASPPDELLLLILRLNGRTFKNWLKDDESIEKIMFLSHEKEKGKSSLGNNNSEAARQLLQQTLEGNPNSLNIKALRTYLSPKPYKRFGFLQFQFQRGIRVTYRVISELRRRILKDYRIGRRTLPTGGIIIAFLGIDGSGKTSGIAETAHFFARQMDVQTNFLGSGKSGASFLRKLIMSVLGFKASFKGHKEARRQNSNETKKIKKPPFYYSLWIWLVTLDREKQVKRIRRGLANGKLVLVDRWLQDQVLNGVDGPRFHNYRDMKGFAGKVARREEKLYKSIKNTPLHQIVKLNISPETSVNRKPEELTLEKAASAIEKLNSIKWPEQTIVSNINADLSEFEVRKAIIENIWKTIQEYN